MKRIIFLIAFFLAAPAFSAPVQEVKSKNGFTVWLVEEHSQPIITTSIAFRDSGAAYDPDGKEGRASMVSALLKEGAGELGAEAFNIALENSAVRLGFAADDDNFYANMQTLSEHKDKAFYYLGLALTSARFDDEAVALARNKTLAFIEERKNKPAARLNRAWNKQVFGTHPYAKPNHGTKKSVETLEVSDFREFTRRYLTSENMIISVVGDINAAELTEFLDKNLERLPEKYAPEIVLVEVTPLPEAKQTVIEQDIPQTMVRFGMQGIKRDDPDYIPAFVANYMLGGGALTSRLGIEIREKRGLAYAVFSSLSPMQHAAIFGGEFSTRNEKVGEAIAALKNTLDEYAKNGVSEQELADAKRFLTGSFVVGLDSNSNIVSFLTMMQLHHLGIDYLDRRNNLIDAVTSKQISEIAKRLIQLDKLQVVMVGKPELKGSAE